LRFDGQHEGFGMAVSKLKRDGEKISTSFGELDRIRLKRSMTVKGRRLASGATGTIEYCHGVAAYEVEFPGIHDIFQIPAEDLENAP
jgi:hypothetical protein